MFNLASRQMKIAKDLLPGDTIELWRIGIRTIKEVASVGAKAVLHFSDGKHMVMQANGIFELLKQGA